MAVDQVVKRDGTIVPYDRQRVETAIYAAAKATDLVDRRDRRHG